MAVSESAIVQLLDAEESRDFVENEVLAPSSQDPAIEYFLRLVMVSFFSGTPGIKQQSLCLIFKYIPLIFFDQTFYMFLSFLCVLHVRHQ